MARSPAPEAGAFPISQLMTNNCPETFAIRVASKSVMILPRAKPGSHAHAPRNFAVVHQIFFGAPRLTFSLFRCSLVHPVQATQRRMVGQRAIQLWVVRPFFCRLSFLAPLAGPARAGDQRSAVSGQSSEVKAGCCRHRHSRASSPFAGPSF